MLKGHNIICFSCDWRQDPLSKHHIMTRLAKHNRVLWINSIGMRNPTVSRQDISRGVAKLKSFLSNRLEKVSNNLHIMSPMALPFHGNKSASFINKHILLWQVQHYQKKLDLMNPILWTFLPNAVGVLGKLGEKYSVYYITDDFTKFTGRPQAAIERMEARLIDKADLLIASAQKLVNIKSRGRKAHLVNHGVDHGHFSRALGMKKEDWPGDIRKIKKPIVGFYGEINDWLDLKMIFWAAELRPDWSFVLLGRVAVEVGDISYLRERGNIHLLGQKKYEQLPNYCAAFDVGLIPMKLNDLTACVNPLKLREYLAAGLPVVSARLPEVQAYENVVRFADNAEELIKAVEDQLSVNREVIKFDLSRSIADESWDGKVEEISELIDKGLNEKN